MADYEFRYAPLTGRLTGKQMIEQTEQAINQLSSLVDSAAGQVEIISTLANEANENAATALKTAEEALATTGRTYITVSTQTDANNYYDSQLIYIADSTSTNIPVSDTGMLEVKTNDNKTACEQVFISDSSGDAYYRNGAITAETVGDVTTYTVTWGGWSSKPASQTYVQQELTNYLPLSGGTVTGGLTVEGTITGNLAGNADTATHATNATNDANGNPIAGTYLPLAGGGSITGDVDITGDLSVSGAITGNVTGNVTGAATSATNDGNGNPIAGTYLPLAGGTMTGSIQYVNNGKVFSIGNKDPGNVDLGWNWANREGAGLGLRSTDHPIPGEFNLYARDSANICSLEGKPDGSLTWNTKNVERVNASGSNYIRYESGLQLCWGLVRINVNSTTSTTPFAYRGVVTITFPVAFRGTPFGVSNVDDGSPWWTTTARAITSTTMQVEASGNESATKDVCWFAVGNWK